MKVLIYLLFTIGIAMFIIGYVNSIKTCPHRKIKYKYIPRKEYDEQMDHKHIDNVKHIFN